MYGGVLRVFRSDIRFGGSFLFTGNKAGWGAALYGIQASLSFAGESAIFKSNEAEEEGGAIHLRDLAIINFEPSKSEFSANSARLGGALSAVRVSSFFADISGSMVFKENTAHQYGGAAYIYEFSKLSLSGGGIVFANNSAGIEGGALWIGSRSVTSINALSGDISFYGNRANGGLNDIYISGGSYLEFFASANRKININSGIKGDNALIKKTGAGILHIGADAVVDYRSNFIIEEGRAEIEASDVRISTLSVLSGAELAFTQNALHTLTVENFLSAGLIIVNVNLKNFESDILKIENYADISSSLYINFYGYGTDVWNPINIIDYPIGGNVNFANISGNLKFDLQNGADGRIMLQLLEKPVLSNMLPYTSFYANLRTLPLSPLLDYVSFYERKTFYDASQNKTESALWFLGLTSLLTYKESADSIGKFTAGGIGAQIGIDVFDNGGFFASYQTGSAKQGSIEADTENMEFGLYKGLKVSDKVSLNIMGSFGMQSFEVQQLESFNSKSLKLSLGAEYIKSKVDIFGNVRLGYSASGKIETDDLSMSADDYFKADIIAGLKKDYKITDGIILGGKIYGGFLIAGQDVEFKSDQDVPIKGAAQDDFFGGAGIKADFQIFNNLGVFGGVNAQSGGDNISYIGYLGIDYKFSNAASAESKKVKETRKNRKIVIGKSKSFRLKAAVFENGEYELHGDDKTHISDIAQLLKRYKIKKITVEGHTDSIGEASYNMALSRRRAEAVYRELMRNGIPKFLMQYTGYFYLLPIQSNNTEEGKRANRRADIFVELYSTEMTDNTELNDGRQNDLSKDRSEIQIRNEERLKTYKDRRMIFEERINDSFVDDRSVYDIDGENISGRIIEEIDLDNIRNVPPRRLNSAEIPVKLDVKTDKNPQSAVNKAAKQPKKTKVNKNKSKSNVKKTAPKKSVSKSKK
jgi:outer membrane protein OmpA-like peptidoglycan-associated protein